MLLDEPSQGLAPKFVQGLLHAHSMQELTGDARVQAYPGRLSPEPVGP